IQLIDTAEHWYLVGGTTCSCQLSDISGSDRSYLMNECSLYRGENKQLWHLSTICDTFIICTIELSNN
uniref:Ricin B lectin domain-containing protein n=1 Tax=Romanomermis culicivorax TaxID=13658 RepID=A0A915L2S9_ROMCU